MKRTTCAACKERLVTPGFGGEAVQGNERGVVVHFAQVGRGTGVPGSGPDEPGSLTRNWVSTPNLLGALSWYSLGGLNESQHGWP